MNNEKSSFETREFGFNKESYKTLRKEYRDFYQEVINTFGLDSFNLCSDWSYTSWGSKLSVVDLYGYRTTTYIINKILEQKRESGVEEPRVLEVGSYVTGLFPAMFYSQKGFKAEVIDKVNLFEIAPDICNIATENFNIKIHQTSWENLPEELNDRYDIIYSYFLTPGISTKEVEKSTYRALKEDGVYVNISEGADFSPGFLGFYDYLCEVHPLTLEKDGKVYYTEHFDEFIGSEGIENSYPKTTFFRKRDRSKSYKKIFYTEEEVEELQNEIRGETEH